VKKKKTEKKKLVLVRTTVRPLDNDQLQQVAGGQYNMYTGRPTAA
jgi:hypothetical protein